MEKQRRSRYFRQPTGKHLEITPKDASVLDILQTYRFLPSTFLKFFTGTNSHRLGDLRHETGLIDCRDDSWHVARNRERPILYELTAAGRRFLIEKGLARFPLNTYSSSFEHAVGECLTQALFEIGAKLSDLTYISPEQVYDRANLDQKTFSIPVQFSYVIPDTQITVNVEKLEPDGLPHGFKSPKTGKVIYFPGFEYDRTTETLKPKTLRKADIYRKLRSYRESARQKLFKSHLDIPNAITPIVTINERHLHNMMELLSEITEGRGSSQFIFKAIPDFAGWEGYPLPDAKFLTEGWLRVGKDGVEPFSLLSELDLLPSNDTGGFNGRERRPIDASEEAHRSAGGDRQGA